MRLASAVVGPFKSIDRPQTVTIDPSVTVLVGMNEAGKTVFLQGLNKCRDILGVGSFNPLDDYPRKDLPAYLRSHDAHPATVVRLAYELTAGEATAANRHFQTEIAEGFSFSLEFMYDNSVSVELAVDERPVIAALLASAELSDEARASTTNASSLRGLRDALKSAKLTYSDNEFLGSLEARVERTSWPSVVSHEVWTWLEGRVPKFLYFGDYEVLPSKMNLKDLATRQADAQHDPTALTSEHRGVLALLRMADIAVVDFARPGGYEQLRAKIEGVSIALTDQIMEFWKQNEDLEVQIDITPDAYDEPPFNDGPNLYLRIKNRRHRGVSTPFKQRSRGFIWFFSFLVWFDSVQQQLARQTNQDVILLLDEPGLSLHALAQRDLLIYIDSLASKHQVVFTTHSPFLIDAARLDHVRTVEDQPKFGTTISSDVSAADPRTVFPLRAALAWSLTQSLLTSPHNLLVDGPADLLFLSLMSSRLEWSGQGLRRDIALVPVGGLEQVAAFSALVGGGTRSLALLQNDRTANGAGRDSATAQALSSANRCLKVAQYRAAGAVGPLASDLEDLFEPGVYLALFTATFAQRLGGRTVNEADLPAGDRIVDRLERWLAAQGITDGVPGFDRYLVAAHLAMHPGVDPGSETAARFAALFAAVNGLF